MGEVEDVLQAGEEVGEVFFGKQGGSAAAEVDGAEGALQFLIVMLGLGEEGVDEGGEVGFARGVFVEGAVGADLVAEREVEVEAERFGHGLFLAAEREGERTFLSFGGCGRVACWFWGALGSFVLARGFTQMSADCLEKVSEGCLGRVF